MDVLMKLINVNLEVALDMAYAKPANIHQLKDDLSIRNCKKINIKLIQSWPPSLSMARPRTKQWWSSGVQRRRGFLERT